MSPQRTLCTYVAPNLLKDPGSPPRILALVTMKSMSCASGPSTSHKSMLDWRCALTEFGPRGGVFNLLEETLKGTGWIHGWKLRQRDIYRRTWDNQKSLHLPQEEKKVNGRPFQFPYDLNRGERLWFHLGKHLSTPERWRAIGHIGKDCLKTSLLLAGLSGLHF